MRPPIRLIRPQIRLIRPPIRLITPLNRLITPPITLIRPITEVLFSNKRVEGQAWKAGGFLPFLRQM